jgi:hypothetical protein
MKRYLRQPTIAMVWLLKAPNAKGEARVLPALTDRIACSRFGSNGSIA